MAEVMARRYGIETKWPRPDLIVLDGGKGQLDAALPVIRSCGIDTPVIGLAKAYGRNLCGRADGSDYH